MTWNNRQVLNWSRWPNFERAEFVCHCGCGRAEMDFEFMDTLQILRRNVKAALIINSGFRCPAYNVRLGGKRGGSHTKGKAADISCHHALAHDILYFVPLKATGIGISQKPGTLLKNRFIHLDSVTTGVRPTVWSYK